ALEPALGEQPPASQRQRHLRTGDRCAAGPAVGLEHVAVEIDGPFAQRLEVDHRAQRPSDQALDLDRASVLAPSRGGALPSLPRRGRQPPLLRGHPPPAPAPPPPRRPPPPPRRA